MAFADQHHQEVIARQLKKIPINPDSATKFYAHMFTVAPDLRSFFKGAETIEPTAVHASERFQKQGQRTITAVNILVLTWHNEDVFDSFIRDLVDRHRRFKGMEYAHWEAFFGVWYGYLEKMLGGPPSAEETQAWSAFKKHFLEVMKKRLPQKTE